MQNEFNLDRELIYLNHALAGPWPKRTAIAIEDFNHEAQTLGASRVRDWQPHDTELRMRFRRLLNTDSVEDIAILKNTSEAVSMVAFGLAWNRGDNIVLPASEFPSNYVAWSYLSEIGVETRRVSWQVGEDAEEALMNACDENTRVLATSSVQFASGFRMNLARLGEFCRGNDILFSIDAIQQLGALSFDLHNIHADFIMAGVHKWMLAPEGMALFWSRPEARELLAPTQLGWRSRQNMLDFEPNPDWTLASTAQRFESGTQSQLAVRATNASLSLLEEITIAEVERRIHDRIEHLIQGLGALPGVSFISDLSANRRSGILCFKIDGDNKALYQHLQDNGVFCASRLGGIRFSPHYYLSMSDLDQAIKATESFLQRSA